MTLTKERTYDTASNKRQTMAYDPESEDDDDEGDDFDFGHNDEGDDDNSSSSSSTSEYEEDEVVVSVDENDKPNKRRGNDDDPARAKKKRGMSVESTAKAAVVVAKKKKAKKDSSSVAAAAAAAKETKTIEQTYQKKTQLEHILLRPDTYVGSVEPLVDAAFVHDPSTNRIVRREVTYTPGFYKMYDEIVVNAADNKQRDPDGMDRLDIDVDPASGVISVTNNGRTVPVVRHKDHGCYVPTLIFGHLLMGSNFDDDERKTTGGRNGYGAKLANIFSERFAVECLDAERGLRFSQVWRNNMRDAEEPIVVGISSAEGKRGDYTKITFRPDFAKLNMTHLDNDAMGLISKRAYDIAGSMASRKGKRLNVYLNGDRIKVHDFRSYLSLFDGIPAPAVYEKIGDDWEVGIGPILDGSGFQQISFVNAIATTKGGGHVDYVANSLVRHLQAAVKKKNRGGKEVKPNQVKNHLAIFVNCLVENPTFDSQTKENLTTKPNAFKKHVLLSDQFVKRVEKCGVVESIMQLAKFQEGRALQRKGGTKKSRLSGIVKLDDANCAGTSRSRDCTLIVTEGDSAKSFAMSGLSIVGRDCYGVFPLKGKPLNVRDATHAQIMKNEEIMNLVEIMGLKFNTTYTEENIKTLRYGSLMIMADQDHDGSHIKGLVINFIHHFWPSLLDVRGFLKQFITPIVKCTKGKKSEAFFTLPEYEAWKESTGNDTKGWTIKYYKGLGTSTSSEAKEYFSNLNIHEISFNEIGDDHVSGLDDEMNEEESRDVINTGASLIEMAFSKSKVEARKWWLSCVKKDTFIDYRKSRKNGINYSDFINRELVLFSQYDNIRSIPHLLDGFKPSQRKVLFACFKKKLKTEIKVAQLAGFIGEHSSYHHGEASLHGAIIGMAQTYCGSNNVNLLYPGGQFGTRRMGGKDHASARYIFTRLEKIARAIFHPDDDPLLNYLNDDGLSIEPEYYMPVIPMVLVNGSEGIGTGWSCTIQNYDPRLVIANIRKMIKGEEPTEMHPHFCGYRGDIIAENGKREGRYVVKGKIKRINATTMIITELPIGKWTQDYKAFLEGMMTGTDKSPSEISDFKENHTDTTVSFTVNASKEMIDAFEEEKEGLHGKFKLSTSISTTNMTAFDKFGKLKTYKSPKEILLEFYRQRKVFYIARKDMLLHKLRADLSILNNKVRFVKEVCRGDLIVSNRKQHALLAELVERGYDLSSKDEDGANDVGANEVVDVMEDDTPDAELAKGYEYLLGMKIWSLSFERAEELCRQKAEKVEEVKSLEGTSPEQIWLNDLDAIEELLDERDKALGIEENKHKRGKSKVNASVSKKRAKRKQDENKWDSEQSEESYEESESESDSEDGRSASSASIDSFKCKPRTRADVIAPAKMSIHTAKKGKLASKKSSSKIKAELKPNKEISTGGGSRRIFAPKARAALKGKTAVSLGVSPKYSFKLTKKSPGLSVGCDSRDRDVSVVNNAGLERMDDLLVDSDESTEMDTTKERHGKLSKSKLKRKFDESESDDSIPSKKKKVLHDESHLIDAQSRLRRGSGKAEPNYAVDGSASECSSESESGIEDESY